MKVTCSRCGTEYNFDDSKVTEEGVKVKCTRCDNVFRVRKKAYAITEPVGGGGAIVEPVSEPVREETNPPTYTGSTPRQWMIRRSTGEKLEFKEMTTLQRWIVERKVASEDEISHNGIKWKRLGAIPELAPFFKAVEDEDADIEEARRGAGDPRVSTGEFMREQLPENDRTEGRINLPPPNGNGNGNGKPSPHSLDAWAEERPTTRNDPERERREKEQRDAERPTHDPSANDRQGARPVVKPKGRGRGAVVFLGFGAVVVLAGVWAQFTEMGKETSRPMRLWIFATTGLDLTGGEIPVPSPTAIVAASPTPGETAATPVTPVPVESATPAPTPTEVAVSTPVATPTEAATVKPASPTPTKVAKMDVDKLLQLGFEAYSRGRYREAINKYQAAVNQDPDNSEAYALLGLAYLDSGNDDLAESSLEAAIRLNPRFADAHRYLGMLYARRNDKARAITSFNTYLDLRPNGPTSDDVRRRVAGLQGG